jgi:drug/metabolite transporter (DMT)-like permease
LGTWLLAGAKQVEIAAGDWWVIASCIPWALHITLVGWVAERWSAPYRLACVQFAVCAVLGLATAWWLEPLSWAAIQAAAGAIAYTGLISVGVGYTAQVVAQRYTHPADAAIILSSETVFAALFGALLMGDRLSLLGFAGCSLILVCIVAAQWLPLVWRRGASV